jgi:hypothetical protein
MACGTVRATLDRTKEAAVNARTLKEASTLVMLGSTLAFLVVLFLDWHRTTVDIAGVTRVQTESMGWSGWGLLAGMAAIVLVALNLRRMRRGVEPEPTFGIVDLVLGVITVCATVAAVFSGTADVQVAVVGVESGTILWPAWLGLVLSIVTAISAAIVALPEAWQPASRRTPTPA